MKEITITIHPEAPFSHKIYSDNKDCYIARELKKMGFENARVSAFGSTYINGVWYEPTRDFDSSILEVAFNKGIDFTLVLRKEE